MMAEWYEWECPHCRRIGQVNPKRDYKDGEMMHMNCPTCGRDVVVVCFFEPTFIAYKLECCGAKKVR